MKRVKSRNFILAVCALIIILISGIVLSQFMLKTAQNLTMDNDVNILYSSSSIKIVGRGNLYEKTPSVNGTQVNDFRVKLMEFGDRVQYEVKLCNMGNEDLVYDGAELGEVKCFSQEFSGKACSNLSVKSDAFFANKKMIKGDLFPRNTCIKLVIDAKFDKDVNIDSTIVQVDKVLARFLRK